MPDNPPVLKTGVPSRVPRVRIQSLRFGKTLQNAVFSHETPSFLGVSLRLWPWLLARICRLVPGCQECKKGETVTIPGKLNGTNTRHLGTTDGTFFSVVSDDRFRT